MLPNEREQQSKSTSVKMCVVRIQSPEYTKKAERSHVVTSGRYIENSPVYNRMLPKVARRGKAIKGAQTEPFSHTLDNEENIFFIIVQSERLYNRGEEEKLARILEKGQE